MSLWWTIALAFTLASCIVGRTVRGGGLVWLGWLTGASTVAALWSWYH